MELKLTFQTLRHRSVVDCLLHQERWNSTLQEKYTSRMQEDILGKREMYTNLLSEETKKTNDKHLKNEK
jgi:hypothetical protein